jgi:hypothetical protein
MLPMIPACQSEAAHHTLELDLTVTAAGPPLQYSVKPSHVHDPYQIDLLDDWGNLNFRNYSKAIGVVFHLYQTANLPPLIFDKSPPHVVFSFGRNYNDTTKNSIDIYHYQIKDVRLSDANLTVSFCYHNTSKDPDVPTLTHDESRYGIYLIDPKTGTSYPIDPGIGNGSNK